MSNTNSELILASEIEPREVEWLWYPYIPFGKVTLLQGDPGDGKSTFVLTLAAILSNGSPLPFLEADPLPPMKIIYQTTEDDLEDTVVPRFIKAGGDINNLIFINESNKFLTFDDDRIAKALETTGARLIVLDPLTSYIGDCSLNAANEIRNRFNHLILTAKKHNCAILIIAHLNKMCGAKALYRTNGSIDIVGAARSTLLIGRENPDTDERILVQQKSNLAPTGSGIRFSIGEDKIEFIEEVQMTADEMLGNYFKRSGRPDDEISEAKDFIISMLNDGPVRANECLDRLKAAGHHERTAKKAKVELNIVSQKQGSIWFWALPESRVQ